APERAEGSRPRLARARRRLDPLPARDFGGGGGPRLSAVDDRRRTTPIRRPIMTPPNKSRPALDAATLGLGLIVGGLGAWTVFAGPTELLPVHWNASGEADGWGTREMVG